MNLLDAWKKLLLFGLFGAAGCLAGWVIGEVYLGIAQSAIASSTAGQAPSLISNFSSASSEAPPPPKDFQDRLDKAGAHTGDVQMSLIWFNTNDLDLHCVDPNNVLIYWQNRRSPSGGELDVDRNAGCRNTTAEPVENIYWAAGTAPMGKYQVYVDYYQQCALGTDETRYEVNVLHGSERQAFSGTITKDKTGSNKKLIYEFELRPLITVAAPQEFQVTRGTRIRVPIAVRRSFYQGKLNLTAESLPEGVTALAASIEKGKDDGVIELKTSDSAAAGQKVPIKIVATASDKPSVQGSADIKMEVTEPAFSVVQTIIIGIWTALLAIGLCLALLIGQNRYLGRPLFASGRIPLVVLISGSALAGFASGSIGQSLFSVFLSIGVGGLGFLVGWILLGGLLGLGISYFVPNLDRKKAALAGLVGGLLGAAGYLFWSHAAEWLGRFAGAALLGFCIGLMVAIVELAFRRVWLEVRYGERETISVNLGPEPVKVGGDARACTIWARGAEGVVLRYFVRDGRVICEDAPTRKESLVGNGDTRTVGTVTLIVRTGLATAQHQRVQSSPAASPSVPPAPVSKPGAPILSQPAVQPSANARPATPVRVVSPPPAAAASAKPTMPMPDGAMPPRPPIPGGNAKPKLPAGGSSPPKPPVPVPGSSAVPPKPPLPGGKPPLPGNPGGAAQRVPPPAVPASHAPAPQVPAPQGGAKPPVPGKVAPKPPIPASGTQPPTPPTPTTPAAGGTKSVDPNACPTCGRISPGRPGARFCMMCDKTY